MAGTIRFFPPRLLAEFTQPQLQKALLEAQHLMQRKKPASLEFSPDGNISSQFARCTVLMERMVLASFEKDPTLATYRQLFDAYPDPLSAIDGFNFYIPVELKQPAAIKAVIQNMSLRIKAVDSHLEHETIRDIHPIDANDSMAHIMVKASSYALIEFVFQWCMHLADEIETKQESPALAARLKEIEPFRYRLSYHAEYLSPVEYFTVDGLILSPKTGFPFNVPQEYFPRTLQ